MDFGTVIPLDVDVRAPHLADPEEMGTKEGLLRAVGLQIRSTRLAANLTQQQLGERAGLVGKYVSEIERGTRDVPLSTLQALVERGLGLRLEIEYSVKNGSRPKIRLPPLPQSVEEVARVLAAVPIEDRNRVLAVVRSIAGLVTP